MHKYMYLHRPLAHNIHRDPTVHDMYLVTFLTLYQHLVQNSNTVDSCLLELKCEHYVYTKTWTGTEMWTLSIYKNMDWNRNVDTMYIQKQGRELKCGHCVYTGSPSL